ncbi:MAG: histone deacetylase family protein [Desulfosoma sp.]|uniref:histone deacetylase family protein n=1 Tax=Desulfosoma sp. TaxID=2603217 RepID=UPI00404B6E18
MLRAAHKTGLVIFPAFDWAISPTHPEREERLLYTQDQIFEEGLLDIPGIVEFKPSLATLEDVQRVHFCAPDERSVLTESHLISAGGAMTIARAVMEHRIDRGFALVRPPGHHAMRVVHGARGFCNINIEAIMIEHLRAVYGADRIAIVDTDCHHGDGTQDIYWHDPDTLFISIHQDGRTLYPGSGFHHELGGPTAMGTTINIPLPPRTSEEGFLRAMDKIVLPILEEFRPELIVNSAGQDNHYTDPITNMNFSAQGYATLTSMLRPHIAVLEGGYSIEGALPYVNVGIILALAGLDYSKVKEPDYNPQRIRQPEDTNAYIDRLAEEILGYWRRCPEFVAKNRAAKEFAQRERTIYYDTDNILENQKERLRVCSVCSGVLAIDSLTDRGYHIYAVHIPRKACPDCVSLGYEWFDAVNGRSYDQVFLQDRTTNRYLVHKA